MTQTITKLDNRKDTATVDIYYHPNNPHAKPTDRECRHVAELYCEKFTFSDFKEYMENCEGEELEGSVYDEIQEIIECFNNSKRKYIWRTSSYSGNDDYRGFFSTKENAIYDMRSQDC